MWQVCLEEPRGSGPPGGDPSAPAGIRQYGCVRVPGKRLAGCAALVLAAAAVTGAVLAGHSGGLAPGRGVTAGSLLPGSNGTQARPMSQAQATARAAALVRGTAAVLNPRFLAGFTDPGLNTVTRCRPRDLPAGSTLNAGPMVSVQRGTSVDGIPGSAARLASEVTAYWRRQGFTVASAGQVLGPGTTLVASTGPVNSSGSFSLGFAVTGAGTATVSAQSPCAQAGRG